MDQPLVVLVEPLAAPRQQLMGNRADEALNHRQMHVIMHKFKHLAPVKKQVGARVKSFAVLKSNILVKSIWMQSCEWPRHIGLMKRSMLFLVVKMPLHGRQQMPGMPCVNDRIAHFFTLLPLATSHRTHPTPQMSRG
jgi:hypothetical protein